MKRKQFLAIPVELEDDEVVAASPSYPGLFVTNRGRVFGVRHVEYSLRHATEYPSVYPVVNGKKRCVGVHLLVTEAFLGQKPAGKVVRHLDGNYDNNSVDNLCYGTVAENVEDSRKHGTMLTGVQSCTAKLTDDVVREMRRTVGTFASVCAAARHYGVSRRTYKRVVRGDSWKHVK